jgi:hypothetical protein
MYFPKFYPEELLYSAIARCRIHIGLENQKELARLLFSNKIVSATTDLPTHLSLFLRNADTDHSMEPETLVHNHTLYPIYAPFIPEARKQLLFKAMIGDDIHTAHGIVGMNTSLIKTPQYLQYCPVCLSQMHITYGEYYWKREWLVAGVKICSVHSTILQQSLQPFRSQSKFEFIAATPINCPLTVGLIIENETLGFFAKNVRQLLILPEMKSPTDWQWTHLYHQLAAEQGALRGQQVDILKLWEQITIDSKVWLSSLELSTMKSVPYWFSSIFRKHRHSFGYLQHLIIWMNYRKSKSVSELIDEALGYPKQKNISLGVISDHKPQQSILYQKRLLWLKQLKASEKQGVKWTRNTLLGNAVYEWLYRYDKEWLLATNEKNKLKKTNNKHIDWHARDRMLVKLLLGLDKQYVDDLESPRRSMTWYIKRLPHSASIEHHLDKLPLCRSFLSRYSESIAEYQIRRLTNRIINDRNSGCSHKMWELERLCGLSKEKMAEITKDFIRYL